MEKAGAISDLKLVEEQVPALQPQEVVVEVKSIGLNFADIFAIKGLYSATPKGSFVPGLEYAGIIAEVGAEVTELQPGQRVMGVTRFGSYTSHIVIDQSYVYPLKEDWSFAQGAAFLVQVLTAYYGLLNLGDLKPKANVLIHSAAGGVGLWANRIAKKYEAFTIGTVGGPGKVDFCQSEGYDQVIVRGKDFKSRLHSALDGRPLNLVMDSIGGSIFKDSYVALASQGRIVVYGSARYTTYGSKPNYLKLLYHYWKRPKLDPQSMINYNKSVMGFNLIYLYDQAGLMKQLLTDIDGLKLDKPIVNHELSYEKLHDAIYLFQSGKTMGKVVVNL